VLLAAGGAEPWLRLQAPRRSLGDRRLREIVERFVDAFERGEVDAILAFLADDATFSMPPYPQWAEGRQAIAGSWLMPGGPPPRLRYVPAQANGQPALGTYVIDPDRGDYLPPALDILTFRGDRIADVTAFRTPAMFPRFGLPDRLRG
jgi:RNA polymerase sigma-70 factor (ECF subfamily)